MTATASASLTQSEEVAPERRVGLLLGAAILVMPYLFSWITLRVGYSSFARMVAFGWMSAALFYSAYLQVNPYTPEPKVAAQQTNSVKKSSVEESCKDVRFTPCFINSDGQTCRNDLDGPITRLVSNGNYSIAGYDVNASGLCVIRLNVQGVLEGNSYARTVHVWGHK